MNNRITSPVTVQSEQATAYAAASSDLLKFSIYNESELRSKGYRFATLRMNREQKRRALNKKKKSISAFGIVSPCMIVGARKCLDEGLEVIDEDGNRVTPDTPDLDKILVIVDGGHRFVAVKELNSKTTTGDKIECYFNLPLNDDIPIYELLRQSNIVTTPWDGQTYLSSLIMSKDDAARNTMLAWVENMSHESGDTAAWQWARLERKVPTKTQLIKASGTDDKADEAYKKISNGSNFDDGKQLYEAFRRHFKANILGCKFFPEWVIDKRNELINAKGKDYALKTLIGFASKLDRDMVDEIEGFKGTDRGRLVKSKLSELFGRLMATDNTTTANQ